MNFVRKMLVVGLFALVLVAESRGAQEAHFRRLEIPANESRLSELARVWEFRCVCEPAMFSGQTLLIAELYRDGRRVKDFRLSRAVYDESTRKKNSILSIGWHRDFHNLISVHDNGEFYSPWAESVHLPDFSPFDGMFFENSLPEDRQPERKDPARYYPFKLYPVLGLCGQRQLKISYAGLKDSRAFLAACLRAGARDAVIIYLYQCESGEEPALTFENADSYADGPRRSAVSLTCKDAETGILFYVESDGRHVAALSPEGKVLWRRDPFVDAKLEPYRLPFPVIAYLGKPNERMIKNRKGKYISISFNSSQSGIMDFEKGDFFFMGQD